MLNHLKREFIALKESFLMRALFFIFLGIILIVLIHEFDWPSYLYTIPTTIISIAGFSILEAGEFKKMMSNTMLGIIQDSRYLKILRRDKLDSMLKAIHQIYYDLPEAIEPDNLYEFIKSNVLDTYLGDVFIENCKITWSIEYIPHEKCNKITANSIFTVRALKDKKTTKTIPVGLSVVLIEGKAAEEHFPLKEWFIKTKNGESEDWKKEDVETKGRLEERSYNYDLEVSITKKMPVEVHIKKVAYEQAHIRSAHQKFPLPTHGLKMTYTMHGFEDINFDLKFDGIPPSKPLRNEKASDYVYELVYDGWMIPGNSVTLNF